MNILDFIDIYKHVFNICVRELQAECLHWATVTKMKMRENGSYYDTEIRAGSCLANKVRWNYVLFNLLRRHYFQLFFNEILGRIIKCNFIPEKSAKCNCARGYLDGNLSLRLM